MRKIKKLQPVCSLLEWRQFDFLLLLYICLQIPPGSACRPVSDLFSTVIHSHSGRKDLDLACACGGYYPQCYLTCVACKNCLKAGLIYAEVMSGMKPPTPTRSCLSHIYKTSSTSTLWGILPSREFTVSASHLCGDNCEICVLMTFDPTNLRTPNLWNPSSL